MGEICDGNVIRFVRVETSDENSETYSNNGSNSNSDYDYDSDISIKILKHL